MKAVSQQLYPGEVGLRLLRLSSAGLGCVVLTALYPGEVGLRRAFASC